MVEGLEEVLALVEKIAGPSVQRAVSILVVAAFVVFLLGIICGGLWGGTVFVLHILDLAVRGGFDRKHLAVVLISGAIFLGFCLLGIGSIWIVTSRIFRKYKRDSSADFKKMVEMHDSLSKWNDEIYEFSKKQDARILAIATEVIEAHEAVKRASKQIGRRSSDKEVSPIESAGKQPPSSTEPKTPQ